MLGMIDLGVFKGFVNKELDDEEIIKCALPTLHPRSMKCPLQLNPQPDPQ